MTTDFDAVILGGGLAGLTLALQLRQRFPAFRVLVLERRAHPLPVAAHKVGESTVEIGAHYFADTLGLRAHLDAEHIRKFGFRFFFSDGRRDLDGVTELGVRRVLPTPTWQIDRGIFETHLGEEALRRGIDFRHGAVVRDFAIESGDTPHRVRFEHEGRTHDVSADWLLDASGRAGLVKRRLGLAQDNDHHAHAVWFRLDARLPVDDWCDNPDWRGQCDPPERWRSTNHLCAALFEKMAGLIPKNAVAVAESSVRTVEDVMRYRAAGADAVLVGEALVTGDWRTLIPQIVSVS